MIVRLWRRVGGIGTEGLPPEDERKIRALNQFCIIACMSVASYGAGFCVEPATHHPVIIVDVVTAVLQLCTLLLNRKGLHTLAVANFLVLCNAQLAYASHYVGPAAGFHFYFLPFATVVFLVVPRRMWFFYPFSLVSTVLFFYFAFVMDQKEAALQIDPFWMIALRALTLFATIATLGLIAFLFDSDTHQAEERLMEEHDRSEKLLLNILPRSISDRLKAGQQSIADGFAEVSVVFADIVGFTELSSKLPPDELVRVLNEVFSRFDELADRFGLEKIKTIGDAYMVAAGLPERRDDHALAAARMALGMRDALQRVNEVHGQHLEIRVGIHSGPVVAGVIGKKKFIYDLWGDTVNIASRMESHGVKGAVHVSAVTARLIGSEFQLTPRGAIQVKGKGEMETFLVEPRA